MENLESSQKANIELVSLIPKSNINILKKIMDRKAVGFRKGY